MRYGVKKCLLGTSVMCEAFHSKNIPKLYRNRDFPEKLNESNNFETVKFEMRQGKLSSIFPKPSLKTLQGDA